MSLQPECETPKKAGEVLVYEFNWTAWLAAINSNAAIASSTFTLTPQVTGDATMTKDEPTIVDGELRTRIRLTGGTRGRLYKVTNTVVTNEAPTQTGVQFIWIRVT